MTQLTSSSESGHAPNREFAPAERRLVPDLFSIFVYVLAAGAIGAQLFLIFWLSLT